MFYLLSFSSFPAVNLQVNEGACLDVRTLCKISQTGQTKEKERFGSEVTIETIILNLARNSTSFGPKKRFGIRFLPWERRDLIKQKTTWAVIMKAAGLCLCFYLVLIWLINFL